MTKPDRTVAASCPEWMEQAVDWSARYTTDESRMGLAIELARQNVLRRTGGPFGAAVFESGSGALVAVGVNSVTRLQNSMLHRLAHLNKQLEALCGGKRSSDAREVGARTRRRARARRRSRGVTHGSRLARPPPPPAPCLRPPSR